MPLSSPWTSGSARKDSQALLDPFTCLSEAIPARPLPPQNEEPTMNIKPINSAARQFDMFERIIERCVWTETGCLEWTGNRDGNGYGQVQHMGKRWQIHRLTWLLTGHEIPEGHVMRHKCDNRVCIEITHLETGTVAQNNEDTVLRGRNKPVIPNALLPEVILLAERARIPQKRLGEMYGVTASAICKIVTGKRRYVTAV